MSSRRQRRDRVRAFFYNALTHSSSGPAVQEKGRGYLVFLTYLRSRGGSEVEGRSEARLGSQHLLHSSTVNIFTTTRTAIVWSCMSLGGAGPNLVYCPLCFPFLMVMSISTHIQGGYCLSITIGCAFRRFLESTLWPEYSSQGSVDRCLLCGVCRLATPILIFVLRNHHLPSTWLFEWPFFGNLAPSDTETDKYTTPISHSRQ